MLATIRPLSILSLIVISLILAPRSAGAQWRSNGAPLCTAADDQTFPVVISDGAGGVLVAQERSGRGGA